MSTPDPMAEAMLQMSEMIAPILEATVGYRAQLEAAGFNETAAELMTIEYHKGLMKAVFAGIGK